MTIQLCFAVFTVSDSRTEVDDRSGGLLVELIQSAGHDVVIKEIVPDDKYRIRAVVSAAIADSTVDGILLTGGTGVTGRDVTPEAVSPLFDKEIPGFGELFRQVSCNEIGSSTLQSRCLGGIANGTFVFCLPGSTGACRTGWEKILRPQFDASTKPCNFVQLIPRLQER